MSLKQAQREIDAEEFQWWWAYNQLEPFGEERADLRMGILASVLANSTRGKDTPAFTPRDFMPDFNQVFRRASDEELDELIEQEEYMFEAMAVAMGGQVITPPAVRMGLNGTALP
jgi:hypothetical protein